MPRLTATRAPLRAPPSRPAVKAKPKKAATPQDRLKTRTLFFRRVKRSLKPGLWVLGGIFGIALIVQMAHSIPTAAPVKSSSASSGHGFARLAAAAGLRVANIKIIGADTTPTSAITQALGVTNGDPILGFSLEAAAARIAALGPVQTAVIERQLPATLIVSVTERAPYAIWQTSAADKTKFVLIDKAGNIIPNQDAAEAKRRDPALVLLVGHDAPQNAATLMADLASVPAIMSRIAAAERVDGLRWNLILKDQAVVKLPVNDEQTALFQLNKLQNSMALLDRPVEVIDMRMPGRMAVQPFPKDNATPASKLTDHT